MSRRGDAPLREGLNRERFEVARDVVEHLFWRRPAIEGGDLGLPDLSTCRRVSNHDPATTRDRGRSAPTLGRDGPAARSPATLRRRKRSLRQNEREVVPGSTLTPKRSAAKFDIPSLRPGECAIVTVATAFPAPRALLARSLRNPGWLSLGISGDRVQRLGHEVDEGPSRNRPQRFEPPEGSTERDAE